MSGLNILVQECSMSSQEQTDRILSIVKNLLEVENLFIIKSKMGKNSAKQKLYDDLLKEVQEHITIYYSQVADHMEKELQVLVKEVMRLNTEVDEAN